MTVRFDTTTDTFAIDPEVCGCGEPLYFSGCDAPDCNSLGCQDCGTGCDLDFVDAEDGGRCATALEEEDPADRLERENEERSAFGMASMGASEETI